MPPGYQWLLGAAKNIMIHRILNQSPLFIPAFGVPILDWLSSMALAKLAFKAAGSKSKLYLMFKKLSTFTTQEKKTPPLI